MAQLNDLLVLGKSVFMDQIKAKNDNDLIAHGNEFNFIPSSYNSDVYINYRTTSGGDGNVGKYIFCKGTQSANYADIQVKDIFAANLTLSASITTANKLYLGSSTQSSMTASGLHIHDLRSLSVTSDTFGDQNFNVYFKQEADGLWKSILHLKGWNASYYAWQLAGNANNAAADKLYYREGTTSGWRTWLSIPFENRANTFTQVNTFTNQVVISYANDVGVGGKSGVLLIGPPTGEHIAIDGNEIMSKASETTTRTLHINQDGGKVQIGSGGLAVSGTTTSAGTLYAQKNILITRSDTASNPFLHLQSDTGDAYVQLNGTTLGLGSAWNKSLLIDTDGNVTVSSGVLKVLANQYEDAYNGALNMNNSDIYGLNSIYTCDLSDSPAEGFHFYRTATTVDTIWCKNGVLSFVPNRTLKDNGTSQTILHTGISGGVFYVTGNSGGTEGVWTGSNTNIPRMYTGLTIAYKIQTAGVSGGTTLNLTTAAGASGAIAVKRNDGNFTTYVPVNSVILLVYDGSVWRWSDYDSNTNTYLRVYRQTTGYNSDYPILVSRTAVSSIGTAGSNGTYSAVYGVIGQDGTYSPTINPHTGQMKIKCTTASSSKTTGALIVSGGVGVSGNVYATNVYGAVWNDYAEFRNQEEVIEPGYCVRSTNSGKVYKTTEKLQACDGIVSDTFGFSIGQTNECKTPLAVAGRVLAYCEGNRYDYSAGDTVCAGPNGLVCKMTREEIKEYPDRIVGIVSEIPEYTVWGSGNIEVNGRIWIKIR